MYKRERVAGYRLTDVRVYKVSRLKREGVGHDTFAFPAERKRIEKDVAGPTQRELAV